MAKSPTERTHSRGLLLMAPSDRRKIIRVVEEVLPDKPELLHRGERWAAKAHKIWKGRSHNPMIPGEDDLTAKQRTEILRGLGIPDEWVKAHKDKLGFGKRLV